MSGIDGIGAQAPQVTKQARKSRATAQAAANAGSGVSKALDLSRFRVRLGIAGGGALGGAALLGAAGFSRKALVIGGIAAGVAALGAVGAYAFLNRTREATATTTVEGGHPSVDSAVQSAGAHGADRLIVRTGDQYAIVGVDAGTDFDNWPADKIAIRNATPEALVSRDGDMFLPAPEGKGFRNTGAVLQPDAVDVPRLDRTEPASVRRLEGVKVGTDGEHRPIHLGALIGDQGGYPSEIAAARHGYYAHGDQRHHGIVTILDRHFLFELKTPSPDTDFGSSSVRMRGAQLTPPGTLTVQQGDTAWLGRSGAERFASAVKHDAAWEIAFPKARPYTINLASLPDYSSLDGLPPRSDERKLAGDRVRRDHFATEGAAIQKKLDELVEAGIVLHLEPNYGANTFAVEVAVDHAEAFTAAMQNVKGVGAVAPSDL